MRQLSRLTNPNEYLLRSDAVGSIGLLSMIAKSALISVAPAHGVLSAMSSYSMHPTAHISTEVLYGLDSTISGAMYSGVPNCVLTICMVISIIFESPKSAILRFPI